MHVKNNSEFGWDTLKKIPTAPDDVWTAYLDAHSKASVYRLQTLENFDDLDDIFSGKIATGKYASSSAKIFVESTNLSLIDSDSSNPVSKEKKISPTGVSVTATTNSNLQPVVVNLNQNPNGIIPRKRKNKHDGVIEVIYDDVCLLRFNSYTNHTLKFLN